MSYKNKCQTLLNYDELGRPVFKNKVRYSTHDKAVEACKRLNFRSTQIKKLVTYKCDVCYNYHIGRNGKDIKKKYLSKLKRENNKSVPQYQFKIIGKIEL